MSADEFLLNNKHILAVDDEEDILESIIDILEESDIDTALDYESASKKINAGKYDLVILDIMGVNGLQLLEESVNRGFPTVVLTAHALNPETLMKSIQKGAISYLPKPKLSELDELLAGVLGAYKRDEPPWKLLFEKLDDYFDSHFGPNWKEKDREFWTEFSRTYSIGKGIQERLKRDKRFLDKGI
jgi:DNA-binding response OmpR family regulator